MTDAYREWLRTHHEDISKATRNLAASCPCVKRDPQYCPVTAIVFLVRR